MMENTASANDRVTLNLYSEQGRYSKTFDVASGKLLKINLRDLRQNGIPDDNGSLLLDNSGVMSLIGSHNVRSKLSYDKIVHSTDQSDYVGFPANPCDYVMGIAIFVDTSSGSQPFPIMKEYDWSLSGLQDEASINDSTVSDPSLAQISYTGSGDLITFTPPNDGATHTVIINPYFSQEVVPNCVACSGGDVNVLSVSVSTQTLTLISSTCQIVGGFPTLIGGWEAGNFRCALSDKSISGLLPDGGSCVLNGDRNCYRIISPTCQQTFCPGQTRVADGACTHFLDQFPIVSSSVPAGCSN